MLLQQTELYEQADKEEHWRQKYSIHRINKVLSQLSVD